MKKLATLFIVFLLALLLTGCEAKTSSNTTDTSLSTGENVEQAPPLSEDDTLDQEPVAETSVKSSVDVASVDKVFNQNYALALDDAKKNLGDETIFCFAKVSFLGGVVSTKGEMDYFFKNDKKIANYYWLVSFDSTQNNLKKRYLAAQKDWGSPACTTLQSPTSFASVYDNFVNSATVGSNSLLLAAKTDMTLVGNLWKLELFNNDGELIFSQTEATTPADTTSPTL